jgi:hypothetical protein
MAGTGQPETEQLTTTIPAYRMPPQREAFLLLKLSIANLEPEELYVTGNNSPNKVKN